MSLHEARAAWGRSRGMLAFPASLVQPNPTAQDRKGEGHGRWERAEGSSSWSLGKGSPRALRLRCSGIQSQPCAGPGSIPGSVMSQSQPRLAARPGDPCSDGNLLPHPCQDLGAERSSGGSSFRWFLEELHPRSRWVCLGSSSSQLELELGWERVGDAAGGTEGSQFGRKCGLGSVIPKDPISRGLFYAFPPHSLPEKGCCFLQLLKW